MEEVNNNLDDIFVNISDQSSETPKENITQNSRDIFTLVCDEDNLELQTKKLSVLATISVITLLSNMAILLAILNRHGKVEK